MPCGGVVMARRCPDPSEIWYYVGGVLRGHRVESWHGERVNGGRWRWRRVWVDVEVI
jgi:hypothetical protein